MPRLDALVARNLACSRAAARDALADGTVRGAGGMPLDDPRRQVLPEELPLRVMVDGAETLLFDVVDLMMNKPVGCVTALRDVLHPTAYALLDGAPLDAELRPVGRLDLDTSGLLLWTTDGTWLQRLTHPKRAVPRTYHAALARPFRPLHDGLVLDDGHRPAIAALDVLASADAHPALTVPADAAAFATITVTGGAYHEVRRIFAALDSHVLALCRVRFGNLQLPADLAPGGYRLISRNEVSADVTPSLPPPS